MQDFGRAPNEVVKGSVVLARSNQGELEGSHDIFLAKVKSVSTCGTEVVVEYAEPHEGEEETLPIDNVQVQLRGYKYSGDIKTIELPVSSEQPDEPATADQPAANSNASGEPATGKHLSESQMDHVQAKMVKLIDQELRDAGIDPESADGKREKLEIGREYLKRSAVEFAARPMADVLDDPRIQRMFLLYDLQYVNGNLGTTDSNCLMVSHESIINDNARILGLPVDVVRRMFPASEEDWGNPYNNRLRSNWMTQFLLNAVAYVSGSCWGNCGFLFDWNDALLQYSIHFHHLNDWTKVEGMARVKNMPSWFIIAELRKTVPICATCHSNETGKTLRARRPS